MRDNSWVNERTGMSIGCVVLSLAFGLWGCQGESEFTALSAAVEPQVFRTPLAVESQCGIEPEAPVSLSKEGSALSVLCDTTDYCPTCDGLFLYGWSDVGCFLQATWDPDGDTVDNACENALAQAFAPLLLTKVDCNWDPGFSRQGGEYFFAAQRAVDPFKQPADIRIAYLPAYYWDCGAQHDFLSWCVLGEVFAPGSCDAHTGDSEFILVDVSYDRVSAHWVTQRVFLSAHCGASGDGDCRWWNGSYFSWVDGRRYGAPRVWVSEGKHANFYSQSKCNSGGVMNMDTCEFNDISQRFPVEYTQQNIGSRAAPLRDCGPAFWGSAETQPTAEECMWRTVHVERFDGWQGYSSGPGASLYGELLRTYAQF